MSGVYTRNLMLWTMAKIGIDPERAFQANGGNRAILQASSRQGYERQNVMPWSAIIWFQTRFQLLIVNKNQKNEKDIYIKIMDHADALHSLDITACDDKLTEINKNPNGIDPSNGNVNQLLPAVLRAGCIKIPRSGMNNMAGAMQHTQKSGWAGGHNTYGWTGSDWDRFFQYSAD
jgi:hypothetical protein